MTIVTGEKDYQVLPRSHGERLAQWCKAWGLPFRYAKLRKANHFFYGIDRNKFHEAVLHQVDRSAGRQIPRGKSMW